MLLNVDIEKDFEDFHSRVSFALDSEKCGVFGPSGSGKTTLMHMLAGLLEPDKGFIELNDVRLFDRKAGINLLPEERRIGVVFQHARLFPHMSVKKNLLYGFKRIPPKQRTIHPEYLIRVLQIENLLPRNVSKLSGGERQRVALGRTILACPHLILLDEPLSGLDGVLKYQIIPYLHRIFDEFSIPMLFISHSLDEMRLMAEEVLIMNTGQIQQQLSIEKLARTALGSNEQRYTSILHLESPGDLGNFS